VAMGVPSRSPKDFAVEVPCYTQPMRAETAMERSITKGPISARNTIESLENLVVDAPVSPGLYMLIPRQALATSSWPTDK
jgi:hypothetical protein